MNNEVELAYQGWPDRLYLIGKDGKPLARQVGARLARIHAGLTRLR